MKNQKGITLVALVITIIVLLILAGVSISLVVGDNGILTKAGSASEATDEASASSAVQLTLSTCVTNFTADVWTNNYNAKLTTSLTLAQFNKELKNNGYQLCVSTSSNPSGADSYVASGSGDSKTYTAVDGDYLFKSTDTTGESGTQTEITIFVTKSSVTGTGSNYYEVTLKPTTSLKSATIGTVTVH